MTELKPGMKVKVEYETTLRGMYNDPGRVEVQDWPPSIFKINGEPWSTTRTNVKVTPLRATHTVTIQVTGDGLTQQEAEHLVESADFSPFFSGELKVIKANK